MAPNKINGLTDRQLDAARGVAEGLSNAEIACRMNIKRDTVKIHLHKTYEKLGLPNRTALAIWMIRQERAERRSHPLIKVGTECSYEA